MWAVPRLERRFPKAANKFYRLGSGKSGTKRRGKAGNRAKAQTGNRAKAQTGNRAKARTVNASSAAQKGKAR